MALTDNLVSYWKLDESSGNASDSVGSKTLTNVNTVTYSAGKINNGANFSRASSQKLTCTNVVSGFGDLTFAMWIKTTGDNTNTTFMGQYESAVAGVWWIQLDASGHASFFDYNGGSVFIAIDTVVINDGNWHFLVCTVTSSLTSVSFSTDGSSFRTYSITGIGGAGLGTQTFSLGYNNGAYYQGSLDAVGIWSRAITSTEVATLYNGGAGLSYPFSTFMPKPNRKLNGAVIRASSY